VTPLLNQLEDTTIEPANLQPLEDAPATDIVSSEMELEEGFIPLDFNYKYDSKTLEGPDRNNQYYILVCKDDDRFNRGDETMEDQYGPFDHASATKIIQRIRAKRTHSNVGDPTVTSFDLPDPSMAKGRRRETKKVTCPDCDGNNLVKFSDGRCRCKACGVFFNMTTFKEYAEFKETTMKRHKEVRNGALPYGMSPDKLSDFDPSDLTGFDWDADYEEGEGGLGSRLGDPNTNWKEPNSKVDSRDFAIANSPAVAGKVYGGKRHIPKPDAGRSDDTPGQMGYGGTDVWNDEQSGITPPALTDEEKGKHIMDKNIQFNTQESLKLAKYMVSKGYNKTQIKKVLATSKYTEEEEYDNTTQSKEEHVGEEVGMVLGNLSGILAKTKEILNVMNSPKFDKSNGVEAWVAEKISLAHESMETIQSYLTYSSEAIEDEEERLGMDLDGDKEEGESAEHKAKVLNQEASVTKLINRMVERGFTKAQIKAVLIEMDKKKNSNPYAIGMAVAEEEEDDKPPLKKKTITKAHDIAKSIIKSKKKKSMEEEYNKRGYKPCPDCVNGMMMGGKGGKCPTCDGEGYTK